MRAGWFFIATLTCCRGETANAVKGQPEIAAAQPVQELTPLDDVAVATRWLEALLDADQKEMARLTRYPFEFHDQNGSCTDQTAPNPEALPTAVACLSNDEALIALLRNPDSVSVDPIASGDLPARAKKWHMTPPSGIVTASLRRNDSRAELELSMVDGGVRGVWRSGVGAPWAVKLATEWVEAVRARDLDQLARLTAYPFELRDTGRDASCGRRLVKGREGLPSAVDCCFGASSSIAQ